MVSTQFFSTASVFVATSIALMHLSGVAAAAHSSFSSLHRRDFAQGTDGQLTQACLPVGEPPCSCPTDLNGDSGVMINLYPGYQCAYPGGACTWDDIDGALQNTHQTNCPKTSACDGLCTCPIDNNGDSGILINQFRGYQCAYTGGACTWDFDGNLANTAQTNCPSASKCATLTS